MISVASSIKFRKEDGLLPSWDNTLLSDILNPGGHEYLYGHKVYTTDTITIQAKVTEGQSMAMQYSQNCWGAWQAMTGETKVTDGTVYDYYEIDIDFSAFSAFDSVQFRAVITADESIVETWISEPCEICTQADDDGLLQVEFFNIDNAFEVDYSTDISHLLRIEGKLLKYKPGGESSVFDNQNEVTKVKGEVKRNLVLETEPLPGYLVEMLNVAMQHDKFFINEVEFVAEALPEFDANSSNLAPLVVTLTQRNVIGLNTHDIGYDCDSTSTTDTMVLQELAAAGEKSFAITDDYMILSLTGYRVAGSPSIKAGTTPGGDDILLDMSLTASYVTEVSLIPTDKASISGGTLYVTVSGAGATANIYIICIKNRQ